MSLNVKNPKAHQLAQQISALTGESMTQAVTTALEERKLRLERNSRFEHAWVIAQDCARRLNEPAGKMMEIEDLYDDETGLPK